MYNKVKAYNKKGLTLDFKPKTHFGDVMSVPVKLESSILNPYIL